VRVGRVDARKWPVRLGTRDCIGPWFFKWKHSEVKRSRIDGVVIDAARASCWFGGCCVMTAQRADQRVDRACRRSLRRGGLSAAVNDPGKGGSSLRREEFSGGWGGCLSDIAVVVTNRAC